MNDEKQCTRSVEFSMRTPADDLIAEMLARKTGEITERDKALLQAAMSYLPHAEAIAADIAKAGGYTTYMGSNALQIAVRKAKALLAEIEKGDQ